MKTAHRPKDRKAIFAGFEGKAHVNSTDRTFEGVLSAWSLDHGGDVIHKGAFARSIDNWRGSVKKIIPLIDNHGKNGRYDSIRCVVGKLIEAEEQDAGLQAKWQVVPSADGDEALARIEGGFINGLSIGYRPIAERTELEETKDGTIRHLREVELKEGSLVIWGMHDDALIDPHSIKSLLEGMTAGTLTPEQVEELTALQAEIGALLTPPPVDEPTGEAKGLAPEQQAALSQRILALKLHRLAAPRHSGSAL